MDLKEVIELHEFLNRREERREDTVEEQIGELIDEIRELEIEISDIKEMIKDRTLNYRDKEDLPFPEEENIPLF